jgi:hypothetical protein
METERFIVLIDKEWEMHDAIEDAAFNVWDSKEDFLIHCGFDERYMNIEEMIRFFTVDEFVDCWNEQFVYRLTTEESELINPEKDFMECIDIKIQ